MTARLSLVLSVAIAWAAFALGMPARAEMPSVPAAPATMSSTEVKPPPNVAAQPAKTGWSRIANFEGPTGGEGSDCIGDPRTARCALDTYVACLARGVYDLCNMSRTPAPEVQITQPRTVDYLVRRLGPFGQSDLPKDLNVKWSSGTPDEQLAVIDLYQCDYADAKWACKTIGEKSGRYVYLLRTGTAWSVAGVKEPGEELRQAAAAAAAAKAAQARQAAASAGVPLPARPSPSQTVAGAIAAPLPMPTSLPARPEPKWKRITNFGADTQTECIGNPKTPTCAVETFIACLAYRDGDLCAIAENYPDMRIEFDAPERRRVMDYNIRSLGAFKSASIPKNMDVSWAPAAGDQLAVVDIRECQYVETNWQCRPFTGPSGHFFFLKPVAGRWYVKDSFEPAPPDAAPATAQGQPAAKPGATAPAASTAVQAPAVPVPPAKPGAAGAPVPLMPAAPQAQPAAPAQPPAQPQQMTASPAPPAIAALAGLPARPDNSWRRVTNFGLGTDSKCIGVPRSPDCVLDTYVACIARRDGGLCALAENYPRTMAPAAPQTERRLIDYKLRELRPFAAAELPAALRTKWTPISADLLAVLDARECDEKGGKWDCRPFTGANGRLFFLRSFDGRWYVKDSFEP
ncbi:MAG: hypothetical protein ACYC1L_13850 [Alphaproteobacteria bacterium]